MADVAVFLQTAPERAPPELCLVDVDAAGVEAEVAAERAHPALLGSGHQRGGSAERRQRRLDPGVRLHLVKADERAEDEALRSVLDPAKGRDPLEVDDHLGRVEAVLEVRHEVRAPRDQARGFAMLVKEIDDLVQGLRTKHFKRRGDA